MRFKNSKNGFIAVTTTIVLALVMFLLAVSLGSTALLARFETVDFSNKKISYFIARSCLDYALLELAENSGYVGDESININAYECSILPIENSGSDKIIKSRAQVNGATSNLKLTIDGATLETVTIEEIVLF